MASKANEPFDQERGRGLNRSSLSSSTRSWSETVEVLERDRRLAEYGHPLPLSPPCFLVEKLGLAIRHNLLKRASYVDSYLKFYHVWRTTMPRLKCSGTGKRLIYAQLAAMHKILSVSAHL